MTAPPRWLPGRALPPYAYLPGRSPHPVRDPAGHSHGTIETPPPFRGRHAWRENEAWLWGVDLYNAGYAWEAHEAWEGLWHTAGEDEVQRQLLQGLIQCTAACVKIGTGELEPAAKLAARGLERLAWVDARVGPRVMGLDVPTFAAAFRAHVDGKPAPTAPPPPIRLG